MIGSVVVVVIGTTHSDAFATDVNSLVSLLTTKLHLIPNGFLVLVIGSVTVALTTIMHREKNAKNVDNQRR